ncbi:MAG: two-component sensor histidine kinase, partial [Liquorilactobacillus satsumensis]
MKKSKDIVAALKEKRKERRFSLKLKWSLGTAIGVLAIFAVFATLLFQSFSSLILRQEKQYASDALSVAANHLATLENELNESNTRRELSSSIEETEQEREEPTRLYSNSVFVAFSRKNIGVGAYNLNGQKVFSSRKLPVNFNIK